MMVVDVDERPDDLVLSRPRELYEWAYGKTLFDTFGVTPDGSRFVDLDDSVAEAPPPS